MGRENTRKGALRLVLSRPFRQPLNRLVRTRRERFPSSLRRRAFSPGAIFPPQVRPKADLPVRLSALLFVLASLVWAARAQFYIVRATPNKRPTGRRPWSPRSSPATARLPDRSGVGPGLLIGNFVRRAAALVQGRLPKPELFHPRTGIVNLRGRRSGGRRLSRGIGPWHRDILFFADWPAISSHLIYWALVYLNRPPKAFSVFSSGVCPPPLSLRHLRSCESTAPSH